MSARAELEICDRGGKVHYGFCWFLISDAARLKVEDVNCTHFGPGGHVLAVLADLDLRGLESTLVRDLGDAAPLLEVPLVNFRLVSGRVKVLIVG